MTHTWKTLNPFNLETSYTFERIADEVETEWTIEIDEEGVPYSWDGYIDQFDEYFGGGLQVEGKDVTGYDGTFELPEQIIEKLEQLGFNCEEVK